MLVAHWLQAYVQMLLRDASRLIDARKRMNLCPLGSGAIAGATLKLDRTIAAEALHFDAPTANSMDATSDRDFALEFTQTLAQIGGHISRFAEEITLFCYGRVRFHRSAGKILHRLQRDAAEEEPRPHRAHPRQVRPTARGLQRRRHASPRACRSPTTRTCRRSRSLYSTPPTPCAASCSVLPGFTAALNFKFERMAAAAESGFLNAMAAATYLVHKGVAFRKAHEKIGNAVRFAIDKGCELDGLTLTELKKFGDEFDEDFFAAISLKATVDCHDVPGGTASAQVKSALKEARKQLAHLSKSAG